MRGFMALFLLSGPPSWDATLQFIKAACEEPMLQHLLHCHARLSLISSSVWGIGPVKYRVFSCRVCQRIRFLLKLKTTRFRFLDASLTHTYRVLFLQLFWCAQSSMS